MAKKVSLLLVILSLSAVSYMLFMQNSLVSKDFKSPWVDKGYSFTNLWFPKSDSAVAAESSIDLTAEAAYFVETETGEILFQKNPHKRLPIASLTKVMTAIVTLENMDWNDPVKISAHAAGMEPDHMLLREGETLTVEELLYGLFLVSANDAAEALAEASLVSKSGFIEEMNIKATQLGMRDTVFINPSGLQEDDKFQYSTAYDVAVMARYAIKRFPKLVDITKTYHIILPEEKNHQDYDLYSGINLLTTYPGVVGFKTGYTPEAGLTIISLARKDGFEVLGVLLKSENRREEAKKLLDYSFSKLKM